MPRITGRADGVSPSMIFAKWKNWLCSGVWNSRPGTVRNRADRIAGVAAAYTLAKAGHSVALLEKGVVVWSGTSSQLRADPRIVHEYLGV